MIEIVLATRNRDKVGELAHALLGLSMRVISVGDLGDGAEVEETGETLAANAWLKVEAALAQTGRPCIGDDTGLEVDALKGAPGVRSSRFAGEKVTYRQNVERLLKEMAGVTERTARFRCVVALADPQGRRSQVEGVAEGIILSAPQGDGGFGYDPVFFVPEAEKTFAEMTLAEKDLLSHRGKAMRAARAVLESWYGLGAG